MAHRFSTLLLAITQRSSDDMEADFVVHVALAACHPVVMPTERSSRARPLWSRIRRRLTSAPALLAGEPPCYGACLQGAWHFLKGNVTPPRNADDPQSSRRLMQRLCSAANPEAVAATLLGGQGAGSGSPPQRQAGLVALRTCMAEAPDALLPPLRAWLQAQLQRSDHDALSPSDVAKWAAPEGMLAAEVGAQNGFVAEVVQDKNVRKVPPAGTHAILLGCCKLCFDTTARRSFCSNTSDS